MLILHFAYSMLVNYEKIVNRCWFTIKCIPKEDARQKLLNMKILTFPKTNYSYGVDSFGNRQIYGCATKPHDSFVFDIAGDVEILQNDYVEMANRERIGMFCVPHGKCAAGKGLAEYYNSMDFTQCKSHVDICMMIMHRLFADFSYVPQTTNVCTAAEEAWKQGSGVCQDYAHIYITLLRLAGIPARYACGLIIGEGASHAWVEAFCGDRWIAFDPTNDCLALEHYIKLGDGRDAADCAINRGIMWGGGAQSQKIAVSVNYA